MPLASVGEYKPQVAATNSMDSDSETMNPIAQPNTLHDRLLAYLSRNLSHQSARHFTSTLDLEKDGSYYWKSCVWSRNRTDEHLVKYGPLSRETIDALLNEVNPTEEFLTSLESGETRMWLRLDGIPKEPGKHCLHWVTQSSEEVLTHTMPAVQAEDNGFKESIIAHLKKKLILIQCSDAGVAVNNFGRFEGYYIRPIPEGVKQRTEFYIRGFQDCMYQFPWPITREFIDALEVGKAEVDLFLEDNSAVNIEGPRVHHTYRGPMTGKHIAWKVDWAKPEPASPGPAPASPAPGRPPTTENPVTPTDGNFKSEDGEGNGWAVKISKKNKGRRGKGGR